MSPDRRTLIERCAARIVTGPLAFLLAGLIDLGVFSGYLLRGTIVARIEARRAGGRAGGRHRTDAGSTI